MLVGRDAERLRIDALVAGARVGRAGVLVVTGEAGIGKTALLAYARETSEGLHLLTAVGSEAERDVAFGGLSQLLRLTDDDLARLPAPQARALGVALALRPGDVGERLAVGAAVLGVLVARAEEMPVGVLVDDAHLLDRPSAEALAFACRRLLADRVFVLVAARAGEPGPLTAAGLPGLVLDGLDAGAVAELVQRTPGSVGGGPDRAALVHRVTGGNPLAVQAVLREDGPDLLVSPGSPAPVTVPAVLTRWYAERLGALPAPTRALLLQAAALGDDLAALARAADRAGIPLDALDVAERAGLVAVDGARVTFTHPLVRASVYALAWPDERRAAHARAAQVLPVGDERRAWHRAEAAVGPDADVADALVRVALAADTRGAHAVAAAAFARSARLSDVPGTRARRLLSAASAAWRGGDASAVPRLVEEATSADTAPDVHVAGLALLGEANLHGGDPEQACRLYRDAADEIGGRDASRAVLLAAEAVHAGFYQGSARAALVAADRIEHLLAGDVAPVARAVGDLAVGMTQVLAGRSGVERVRQGAAWLDAATPQERAGVGPAWLMYGPLWLREPGAVRRLLGTALDEERARSAVGRLPLLLFLLARDGATTDRWTSAAADYAEAVALARELGQTTVLAVSLAGRAWLEGRRGNEEECRALVAETRTLCERHPVGLARVWAHLALGELELSLGRVAPAADELTVLDALLARIDLRDPDLAADPDLVEVLLRRGDRAGAARRAARFTAAAQVKGQPWSLARAARLHGLLAAPEEIDACFTAALALHARTLDVHETARTRLAYGQCLRRARRRVDARVQLRAALQTFERLGARPWADVAAAELGATGEHPVRGSAPARDRLTPRELQIAELLAQGRTTRQAAAALFLSPKTVEYHLRSVYTKLGVTSRAGLAQRLGETPGAAGPQVL